MRIGLLLRLSSNPPGHPPPFRLPHFPPFALVFPEALSRNKYPRKCSSEMKLIFFISYAQQVSRAMQFALLCINGIGGLAKNSDSVIKHQLGEREREAAAYPARRYNAIKFGAMFPSAFNKLALSN